MTFDDSFFVDVDFIPYAENISSEGATQPGPTGTPIPIRAVVNVYQDTRQVPNGVVISEWYCDLYMKDNPDTLNGGVGIRGEDYFRYAGVIYQAQGPANDVNQPGKISLWWVRCLRVT